MVEAVAIILASLHTGPGSRSVVRPGPPIPSRSGGEDVLVHDHCRNQLKPKRLMSCE